jgi:hypothetical protein
MHVLLLCGAFWFAPAPDDTVLRQLDADFEELLKKEKDPQPMRQAARLLDQTDHGGSWFSYMDGVAIIRKTRSKAGIPLLLKYMVLHAGNSAAHTIEADYADALTILTGKEIERPSRVATEQNNPLRDTVQNLYDDWWKPNKDKITTDPRAMTKEQLQVIVHRLLEQVERFNRDDGSDPTDMLAHRLGEAMQEDHPRGRQTWQLEELDAVMAPVLLESAGYEENPPAKGPTRDEAHVLFAGIPILGALRADGKAPQLDKVAADERQSSAVRLTCLLALYRAGEKLDADRVVEILKQEKKLERRLVAILGLRFSADAKAVAGPLVELLDDPNRSVRTAAIYALQGSAPRAALPKLKKVLDELDSPQTVYAAIRTIGSMEGKEPRAALADFLEAAQDDPKKGKYLYHALMAFEGATGQHWIEAGAHPDEYYRELAKTALDWWKTQK